MRTSQFSDTEFIDLARESSFTDLSPLYGFEKLERLDLTETSVEDLSPIAGCSNLKVLWLTGSAVKDISPLSNLEKSNPIKNQSYSSK